MRNDSRLLAIKLLVALGQYRRSLGDKKQLSKAEKRHLLRIRTVKSLRVESRRLND